MPREAEHPWDGLASDLYDWMEGMVTESVERIRGGHRSPFSASTTEAQKREYYQRQMYMVNPDGSIDFEKPNKAGRDALLKSVGTAAYAQIMQEVAPKQGRRPTTIEERMADPMQALTQPMPEDEEELEEMEVTGG